MTLRLRLLLVLVGIVAVGLVVADVVTYASLRSYLFSQVDTQLQGEAVPRHPGGRQPDRALLPPCSRGHPPARACGPRCATRAATIDRQHRGLPAAAARACPRSCRASGQRRARFCSTPRAPAASTTVSYRVLAEPTTVEGTLVHGHRRHPARRPPPHARPAGPRRAARVGRCARGPRRAWRGGSCDAVCDPSTRWPPPPGPSPAGDLSRRVASTDERTEVGQLGQRPQRHAHAASRVPLRPAPRRRSAYGDSSPTPRTSCAPRSRRSAATPSSSTAARVTGPRTSPPRCATSAKRPTA